MNTTLQVLQHEAAELKASLAAKRKVSPSLRSSEIYRMHRLLAVIWLHAQRDGAEAVLAEQREAGSPPTPRALPMARPHDSLGAAPQGASPYARQLRAMESLAVRLMHGTSQHGGKKGQWGSIVPVYSKAEAPFKSPSCDGISSRPGVSSFRNDSTLTARVACLTPFASSSDNM
jgi:hypothetical protein